ncbi:hypothetical protein M9Y10_027437 [Tritrichomonas musculus]|uniref:Rab-GAP TBC domain-containing protein n=1 Tax=Tritrichomonas musculus TaxID=1915356 RepID=A0ABR2H601_9EUKA
MLKWKELIKNWDQILKTDRSSIIRALRIGIPSKHRKKVWSLLTEADKTKAKVNIEYSSLIKTSDYERIIDCDVPRTFPNDPTFSEEMRKSLRNVLVAYSNTDHEIGYYQGMNFIAGLFLYYQDEETAFWSFYSLMQRSHRNYFKNNFQHLREIEPLIEHLVEERLPKISKFLKQKNVSAILYTPTWFITCFIGSDLDFELTSFIFDEFLAFGETILVSFGLTIMSLNSEIVEYDSYEKFLSILTNPGRANIMHNRVRINIEWVNQWITNKQYKKYCELYIKPINDDRFHPK